MAYLPWIGVLAFGIGLAPAAFGNCTISKIAELPVSDTGNRPHIDGKVNGQPIKILIDSGAAITFISEPKAKQLGLKFESADGLRLFGVGGERTVAATRIDSLQFGTFTGKGIRIAVSGTPKMRQPRDFDFILGEDFLSRYTLEFDLAHRVIRLLRSDGCKAEQLAYWAKSYSIADLSMSDVDNMQIATSVFLNGVKLEAILDTGAPTSWITRIDADHAGVNDPKYADGEPQKMAGINGQTIDTWVGTFASFSIGDDETIRNVKLRIGDLFRNDTKTDTGSRIAKAVGGFPSMIVGYDFFLAHRVVVLFKERKLIFTYNGGPIFQAGATPEQLNDPSVSNTGTTGPEPAANP
jgi:predicted aspartyl protease